ncbi:zinc-finger homeodomain protein 1-like [Amaranthus tricolor]|uniref:zinc-finger homeodomain protein 1-like n=1 Tax=Amaranthus tricolor TaxID=29722 RepID=UPI00258781D3|nr:zinc-finger homeodomain protein 1-like [Amaranthus tricolor]
MMEFEHSEDHEEEEMEEEEEEDEESEMATITPTLKKHQVTPLAAVRYRECLKNHAVGIGGHAVDGCGEFMPGGIEGSLDALRCAACNCHRNFHRKELFSPDNNNQLTLYSPTHPRPHHPQQIYQFYPYNRTTPPAYHVIGGQRPLALPSPTTMAAPTNNVNNINRQQEIIGSGEGGSNSSGKKRFRTKFTQDQKDKMLSLAERLDWKIQKQDDVVVHQFCNETGVKRHVLKVWMHNNKHTLGKKP